MSEYEHADDYAASGLPSWEETRHRMALACELQHLWDRHWTVPAWSLQRRFPEEWGTWHRKCRPDLRPPKPIRIADKRAAAIAAELETLDPSWLPHCRVCGGLLAEPPRPADGLTAHAGEELMGR